MKRLMILIALCLFPSLVCTPVHAVQLEQGWYARFGFVGLIGNDKSLHTEWGSPWRPTIPLGNSGPLTVTDALPSFLSGRTFKISRTFVVSPGLLIEDEGLIVSPAPEFHQLGFSWESSYDATRLQLRVVRRKSDQSDEIIWTQTESGYQVGPGDCSFVSRPLINGEKIVFQLVAVPELPTWIALGFFAACLLLSRACSFNPVKEKGVLP